MSTQSIKYSSNGTAYTLSGPSDALTVILIHGLGLNHQTWADYFELLETQYQVLSYDLYGHGQSASPPERPTLTLFANQLKSLIDTLHIKHAALIGFSLGGMINRRFALDYPNHVSALAILNSPHERSPAAQQLVEARAADTAEGGPAANIDETLERWFTTQFRNQNKQIVDRIRNWVLSNNHLTYSQCRQVLANGVIELIRPKPGIQAPTLIITCENDSGSTPAMSHAIAAEIPNSETLIIPHLQHMGLVEEPALFTQPLMRFLHTSHR